jgi:hypothetical protein
MFAGTSRACYLLPGMKIKIKAKDVFVRHGVQRLLKNSGEYEDVNLIQGFALDDNNVGQIEAVEGEPAVYYTHKKYAPNRILFFALTGETGYVDVISVPIHDHASIVTGGPAYGTYFTDDETLGGE